MLSIHHGTVVARGRRQFLKFLGAGLTGAYARGLGPLAAAGQTPPPAGFAPIRPTSRDALVLPAGYRSDIVARWSDRLPGTNARFGYNADFTAFLPLREPGHGVLVVNHEYVSLPEPGEIGVYLQTFPLVMGRAPRLEDEMHDVGVSVLHLRRSPAGRWDVIASPLTRRYDATSRMRAAGPALQNARDLAGTLENCSGCQTPWRTVLTCEENFQDAVPETVDTAGRGRVGGRFRRNGAHFGWVVEIDPLDPDWTPVKHTMLGRFRHENVALRAEAGRPLIAYMGDDRVNGHVHRFVSAEPYTPDGDHRESLLSRGRLYAAVFHANGTGEWRELAPETPLRPNLGASHPLIPRGAKTLGQVYADLGAIVTDAFRASNLIGATPTGRPEDVEVHPLDRSVYIAFTSIATARDHLFPNFYGEIWRIVEEGDGTGTHFTWVRWKAGGPNDENRAGRVFASPDNLAFDPAGNLWVATDITTVRLNDDARFTTFRNNGMFFVPTSGPDAGVALQFASAPCEAELAGPSWTADRDTMFLSVQHPGEGYGIRDGGVSVPRGSNWPGGRAGDPPLPAVVAIEE
jgi:secreted PhoX family phosphatase